MRTRDTDEVLIGIAQFIRLIFALLVRAASELLAIIQGVSELDSVHAGRWRLPNQKNKKPLLAAFFVVVFAETQNARLLPPSNLGLWIGRFVRSPIS